jgi:Leucine-rich repeat (LRR) protein
LANNVLTEIDPDTFSPLVHLQHFDLSNNQIYSIKPEVLHDKRVLEWLSLANNRLNEINLRIFKNRSKLSCPDLSGNINTKIEEAMFYCTRKRNTLLVTSNKIFEFIASDFCKEGEVNKTRKINYATFVGLENLKHFESIQ